MQATKILHLQDKLDTFFGVSIQIIGTIFIARLLTATSVRFVYPFIPQISAGLGLTVVGFGWLIFFRSIVGVTGPIFGVLADRIGRRKIMAVSLLAMGVGMIGLTLTQQWWAVGPMLLFGIGITASVPVAHAYISDQVIYEKRGRVLGTIEFSWALSGIVALPFVGWLIEMYGWHTPFLVFGSLSLIAAAIIWFGLPAVEHKSTTRLNWSEIKQLILRPNVLATIGVSLTLFMGDACFFTIWGIWLSHDYGLGVVALGLVATTIGLAELTGSGVSTVFIDRLGKRRGSLAGLLLAALIFTLLPFTQIALWLSILGLILLGVLFEFTIVSLISLYSEQAPEARATVFSLASLGTSLGIAFGALIATNLWGYGGLWPISTIGATSLVIAAFLLWKYLREG